MFWLGLGVGLINEETIKREMTCEKQKKCTVITHDLKKLSCYSYTAFNSQTNQSHSVATSQCKTTNTAHSAFLWRRFNPTWIKICKISVFLPVGGPSPEGIKSAPALCPWVGKISLHSSLIYCTFYVDTVNRYSTVAVCSVFLYAPVSQCICHVSCLLCQPVLTSPSSHYVYCC